MEPAHRNPVKSPFASKLDLLLQQRIDMRAMPVVNQPTSTMSVISYLPFDAAPNWSGGGGASPGSELKNGSNG
jgi:hypothetical protein